MLNAIVQLGEFVSFATLVYGALLCLEHSDLFQEVIERQQRTCSEARMGSLERGELTVSI
ncbi:MAG: hypothetical protein IH605_10805 [Burkholderiales bacterium]|nr:hypothetical protein [Burkholderiales bacterium]